MSCALKNGLTKELSQSLNELCDILQENDDTYVNKNFIENELVKGLTLIYGLSPCLDCPKLQLTDDGTEIIDCVLEKLGLFVNHETNLDIHKHNRNFRIIFGIILKLANRSLSLCSDALHKSEELDKEGKRLSIDRNYFESAKKEFYRNSERSSSNFAERAEFYSEWKTKPEGTRAEMADKLGCSKRTVQRDLKKLKTFDKSFAGYRECDISEEETLSEEFYERMNNGYKIDVD